MKHTGSVLVTENRFDTYEIEREVLAGTGAEVVVKDCRTRAELLEAVAYADAALVNLQRYDAEVINSMKRCRIISRYGIGYDNVDISTAADRGIWVANVPDYGAEVPVSEHAVALLLSCIRKIPLMNQSVKNGLWNMQIYRPVHTVQGKRLGIIGYGNIGRAVAAKMAAFGLAQILIYDPFIDTLPSVNCPCRRVDDLAQLLAESDYITVHTPLTDLTRGMIGSEEIGRMKDGVIIINTARGGIINEAALIEGLQSGKVAGAGIDTLEEEPLSPDSPLKALPSVILTNHVGFYSEESLARMRKTAAENVREVLNGGPPVFPVNRPRN